MPDNFQGSNYTVIQRGDVNVPVRLRLKACSASTKNDGSMPYGSSVISSTCSSHWGQNGAATTSLIASATESGNTIVTYLSYSSDLKKGAYHLTAKVTVTLSGTTEVMTREYDLDRIFIKDR
jgi:hypothetical protein